MARSTASRYDGQDKCQGGYGHAWFDQDYETTLPHWCVAWLQKECSRCEKRATIMYDRDGAYRTKYHNPPAWRKHNIVRRIDVARSINHKVIPVKMKKPGT